jgi:hypothetical protein
MLDAHPALEVAPPGGADTDIRGRQAFLRIDPAIQVLTHIVLKFIVQNRPGRPGIFLGYAGQAGQSARGRGGRPVRPGPWGGFFGHAHHDMLL